MDKDCNSIRIIFIFRFKKSGSGKVIFFYSIIKNINKKKISDFSITYSLLR